MSNYEREYGEVQISIFVTIIRRRILQRAWYFGRRQALRRFTIRLGSITGASRNQEVIQIFTIG